MLNSKISQRLLTERAVGVETLSVYAEPAETTIVNIILHNALGGCYFWLDHIIITTME